MRMTKTPVTTATRSSMGEKKDNSFSGALGDTVWSADDKPDSKQYEPRDADLTSICENAREHVPQLVVTSPCRIELKAMRVSGLSFGCHAEEESICSDSGFGGSPAPSLLRKLSNASSSILSPASSFEEYEEDGASSSCGNHINVTNVSPCLDEPPPRLLHKTGGQPLDMSLPGLPVNGGFHGDAHPQSTTWKNPKSTGTSSPLSVPPRKPQQWVQVVGHAGSFHAGDYGMLLKRFCEGEQQCLQRLMDDSLRPFVPAYHGVVQRAEQDYNMMDDLLTHFNSPAAIMDCKMGSRTYLEEELMKEARERPQPRKDMYEKMVAVDPEAPTAQERVHQAVLKTRYMQWRETLSSTTTLGFRIEGVKKADGVCNTNFKRTKSREQVLEALDDFVDRNVQTVKGYLRRLKELRLVLETSSFFKTHEVVGSSLLFVHDGTGKVGVWMIDFGKTVPLPSPLTLDHRTPWVEGNREDGYLWGLDNLINILTSVLSLTSTQQQDPSVQKRSAPQHHM